MYGYTYRPSAAKRQEFHEKMLEVEAFCKKYGISASRNNDSYYFSIEGQRYRVSNHSVEASNRAAFDEYTGEQLKELYHDPEREEDVIEILAGKLGLSIFIMIWLLDIISIIVVVESNK